MITHLSGQWGDLTQQGVVVRVDFTAVTRGDTRLPDAPERLLFLRADGDLIIGQGHASGLAYTFDRGAWVAGPNTHGAFCVETDGTTYYAQTSPTTFAVRTATTDWVTHNIPPQVSGTSQGFLDVTSPSLMWTDAGRVRDGLVLPQLAGPYTVGQHPTISAVYATDGITRGAVIAQHDLFEPRAAFVNNELRVLVRTATDLVLVTPPFAPDPIPSPPTEEPSPMPTTTNLLPTLQAMRSRYGSTMTDNECVELINEVAWLHRNDPEQWGLSYKAAGKNGIRYDGKTLCHDVIMRPNGEAWDVLGAAGAASTPIWNPVDGGGYITDPSRYWVPPISPSTPSPQPPTPPPPQPNLGPLQSAVTALTQQVALLAGEVSQQRTVLEDLRTRLAVLQDAVDKCALTSDLHALTDLTAQRITAQWPKPIEIQAKYLGRMTGKVG